VQQGRPDPQELLVLLDPQARRDQLVQWGQLVLWELQDQLDQPVQLDLQDPQALRVAQDRRDRLVPQVAQVLSDLLDLLGQLAFREISVQRVRQGLQDRQDLPARHQR
jgi:hypothetical protein